MNRGLPGFPAEAVMGGWVESGMAAHMVGVASPTWRAGLDLICKRRWCQWNKTV